MIQEKIKYKSPWKRQRILKREDIPPIEEIFSLASSYKDPQERALFILAYQTGGRISELIKTKYLKKREYFYQETADKYGILKRVVMRNANGSPLIKETKKIRIDYAGILKKNILFTKQKNKDVMIIAMQNRKNKKTLIKRVPVPVHKELPLIQGLIEYLNTLHYEDPLFNFGYTKASRIINKVGLNPHFLRDIRLTHMATIYDFNEYKLMRFAGWSSTNPAPRYVKMKTSDLVDTY